MKSLKIAVTACSLFAAAAAFAQAQQPSAGNAQQVSQANAQQAAAAAAPAPAPEQRAKRPAKTDECVGPAGYCNMYFGS